MKVILFSLILLIPAAAIADEMSPGIKYLLRVFGVQDEVLDSSDLNIERELEKHFPKGTTYEEIAVRVLDASRRMKYATLQVRYSDTGHQLLTNQPEPELVGAHSLSVGFLMDVEGKEAKYYELCFSFSCDGSLLGTAVCFGTRNTENIAARHFEHEFIDLQQVGRINSDQSLRD